MNEGSEEVNRHYDEYVAEVERIRSLILSAEERGSLWARAFWLASQFQEEPSIPNPRMMTVHPWFRGQR